MPGPKPDIYSRPSDQQQIDPEVVSRSSGRRVSPIIETMPVVRRISGNRD